MAFVKSEKGEHTIQLFCTACFTCSKRTSRVINLVKTIRSTEPAQNQSRTCARPKVVGITFPQSENNSDLMNLFEYILDYYHIFSAASTFFSASCTFFSAAFTFFSAASASFWAASSLLLCSFYLACLPLFSPPALILLLLSDLSIYWY